MAACDECGRTAFTMYRGSEGGKELDLCRHCYWKLMKKRRDAAGQKDRDIRTGGGRRLTPVADGWKRCLEDRTRFITDFMESFRTDEKELMHYACRNETDAIGERLGFPNTGPYRIGGILHDFPDLATKGEAFRRAVMEGEWKRAIKIHAEINGGRFDGDFAEIGKRLGGGSSEDAS